MAFFLPHRIMVPINGAETDDEAVRLSCRLARRAKAKVYVATVLEVDRSQPLGAVHSAAVERAETMLSRAEKVADELDTKLEVEILQAREAGPAIVDEIKQWRADLVVVGMPFRERFGEFYMGKTAPYVLRNAPCRLLLLREPPPADALS